MHRWGKLVSAQGLVWREGTGHVPFHHSHVILQIFTNKCLKPGCKQKEMMKVICDQCHKNYCLKHRHPLDHDCSGAARPLSKAG